jgi:hypothetical protein
LRVDDVAGVVRQAAAVPGARGLHSFTFRLNVSTFCGIRWVHEFPTAIRQGNTGRCDENG